ncbi:TetR/AcrR family transcriptional regulator [Sphingobium sp. CCH11-B1]|jgi:AcrR family transcriptional regulator|uniref:TetR/AcrR family transcriptional regulator n=1 Tax=Sphingobium sp. CCH11-B1 TaxID=1768781 RepID=UPI000831200B|nr:TetR/AcrR family transcriptional regulator [Sphingobium sp. CCH11-B1]MEA3391316.1 TetR/AcrR family transcriptional regulator [Pseudomonadota bacterium]
MADAPPDKDDKTPRTARGERTRRALLSAAAQEFGEKGFHEGSISGITRRAGCALGSFYTYFASKDDIFRALVNDMSGQVRDYVSPRIAQARDGIEAERIGLLSFLEFARDHKEIYRIIDEAEFVDQAAYRAHYENTANRMESRLRRAADRGEITGAVDEVHAWAIMGMNVFLGLRYGVWDDSRPAEEIASIANALIERGIGRR